MGLLIPFSLCVVSSLKGTWHPLRCSRLLSCRVSKVGTTKQGSQYRAFASGCPHWLQRNPHQRLPSRHCYRHGCFKGGISCSCNSVLTKRREEYAFHTRFSTKLKESRVLANTHMSRQLAFLSCFVRFMWQNLVIFILFYFSWFPISWMKWRNGCSVASVKQEFWTTWARN